MIEDENKEKNQIQKNASPVPGEPKVFSWGRFGELGIEFAVVTALPLLIFIFLGSILKTIGLEEAGTWADYNKENSNFYKISGLLIAVILSFYMIFRKIKEIERLLKK